MGPDVRSLWSGLEAGRLAVQLSPRLKGAPSNLAATVAEETTANLTLWGRQAIREALQDAGLLWPLPNDIQVAAGLAIGWAWPDQPRALTTTSLRVTAEACGLEGAKAVFTSYSACAAGLQLVEEAARWIRLGWAEVVLVVASDSRVHRAAVEGYARLGALAQGWEGDPTQSCRPFDRHRSGFVVGEGAGALVMESEAFAKRRRARVRGWVVGAASTCDAGSPVAPDPSGRAAERCVRLALEQAGIQPGTLGYVNTHGTGTPLNDRVEAELLARILGSATPHVPCGSFKSMLGHLAMASGLVELIGCLPVLAGKAIPPNRNLDQADVPLFLTGWPVDRAGPGAILKTSFGFGGANTAVVITTAPRISWD